MGMLLYGAITPVAFVTPRTVATNPGYMTPHLPAWRNASDGIAVYPEVESRNWMNANKVIRWVLWFPGGNGGAQALQYDPKDLIACYAPGICTEFTEQYTVKPLRLIDYGLEYLHDLPVAAQRQGNITYMGKTKWRRQGTGQAFQRTYPPMAPGEPLPRSMLKRERLEKFAKADMFISYDAGTWRNVEAALAGAKSVVIPVEGVTKEEW
ncbi:hypothetical protein OEZ86_013235 [Tetradesmus obliquus]|nr:hypothetical protein OEZ86_013235 [Tetradesmus obliquus]